MLLLIGGIHPNPGPTSVKTIFSQPPLVPTPSPSSFTLPFANPESSHVSIPHLMDLNFAASHGNSTTSHCNLYSSHPNPTASLPNSTTGQPSIVPHLMDLNFLANSASSQSHPTQDTNINLISSQSHPTQVPNVNSASSQPDPVTSQPVPITSQPASATSQQASSGQPSQFFLQLNINGVKNSLAELNCFLQVNRIRIACIQETRLSEKSKDPSFPDYTILRKDRPVGNGGGIAILVHHSVCYTPIDTSTITQGDNTMEILGISASVNKSPMNIFNVYLPPASSCPPLYKPDLEPLLRFSDCDTIIMGDLNAHHGSWYASSTCSRGEIFSDSIENSALCVLNTDTPTRLPNNGNPNSPDLTLISAHLALPALWTTHVKLNSDHLPITIDLGDDSPPARSARTYTNFRLADWGKYLLETEANFASLPDPVSCDAGEKVFRGVLLEASGHCIPSGHRKNYSPGLPREAVPLVSRRDVLRQTDPTDPEIDNLNDEISMVVCDANRKAWNDKVKSCGPNLNPSKFWGLLRNLSGKRVRQAPNQPITFGTKVFSKPQSIAKKFCRQYTSVGTHRQNPETRRVIRNIRHKHKLVSDFNPFTVASTSDAIKAASNSTATGPDGLTSLHLKHLGPRGISFLNKLYNLSVNNANLPAIWKSANIIPIPKPGKPLNLSTSYRPISLLSPVVKVLERLLLPFVNPPSLPLSSSQHGFRPFRSTTSATIPLVTAIANGFNEKKPPTRTAVISLDISKAFDSVDHTLLLKQLSDSAINSNVVRWLAAYLRGRSASCLYQSCKSPSMIIRTGVPQGSVLSPSLFNFFVSDFPPLPLSYSFADDFYVGRSSPDLASLTASLNEDMRLVEAWADGKKLKIAPEKSCITLFSPDPAQAKFHPQVSYKGSIIPLDRNPKWLGLRMDPKIVFNCHADDIKTRSTRRLPILKALAGTTFGQSQETLLLTYKMLVRPLFGFGCPVWFPNASDTSIKKLQVVQNKALRTVTGCHMMTPIQHLHTETKELLVKDHLELLSSQYLASAMRVLHPNHAVVNLPPGPRQMKETLHSKCFHNVQPHLNDGIMFESNYKKSISAMHSAAVAKALCAAGPNEVLGRYPPNVHESEETLPRVHRCTLRQLRSGKCCRLQTFQHRIGKAANDLCPECGVASHTTAHIFNCQTFPTTLTVDDLWYDPREAAIFVSNLPSFIRHLPPVPPLRPRFPPRPPP